MEDYNVLHMYGFESDSENSYGDFEEPTLPVAEELALNQDLVHSTRWQDRARKLGERFSARTGGQPGDRGSLYRTPETLELQINQQNTVSEGQNTQNTQSKVSESQLTQSAVSEGQLLQAQALPVIEPTREQKIQIVTPGQTLSQTPGQRPDLEWDSYLLGNETFTPGLAKHHAGLARQLDRGQDDVAPYTSNFARKLVVE